MGCVGTRRRIGGPCCCEDCNQVLGVAGCCKCIAKEICATFTPDDPGVDPTSSRLTHKGDGLFNDLDDDPFEITITLEENCEWHVESTLLSIDETYDARGAEGIGCRRPAFPDLTEITSDGEPGTISFETLDKLVTPVVNGARVCEWRIDTDTV